MTRPTAFSFEELARNCHNYLERLIDANGLPYFNVFWTTPAEAAHDWPDFGDVTSRQLQAAIMLRRMTGLPAATVEIWLNQILALIDPADGQLYRPATPYCEPVADWGDAGLTLYALATAAIDRQDPNLRRAAADMAEGMLRRLRGGFTPPLGIACFPLKPLMVTARYLQCEAALEAARLLIHRFILTGNLFTPDNTFGPAGHMHSNLRTMVGAADYALLTGDPVLYSRMAALYGYVKSTGTRFGFLPEVIGRQCDLIACETCALMDFAGMGVTLANHGHPEYWADMERLARNHFAESQLDEAAWLESDNRRRDTSQFTWRDIGPRVRGAWAGWSAPNHILAYRETLNAHWGGPELRDKTRALQNCCGGSGVHGLFTLWRNAARCEGGVLSVNMHLDKRLPQAEIRCQQPYHGRLQIALHEAAAVRVRIPDFTTAEALQVEVNGAVLPLAAQPVLKSIFHPAVEQQQAAAQVSGNYLELGRCQTGDRIVVSYPLPLRVEEIAVGNPGFRQWRYRVTWKGDTVVRLEPLGNDASQAYSDFDKTEVEVFYGEQGPGRLYQRDHLLQEAQPEPAELHEDDGSLDFWKLR